MSYIGVTTDRFGSTRGVAGATVVIFPTGPALWGQPSRFVAAVTAGNDGAFSMGNLPVGDYYAAAAVEVTRGDVRDPDLLDALVAEATHVSLSTGEKVKTSIRAVGR